MSSLVSAEPKAGNTLAAFGAGCFWGVEKYFRQEFPGIVYGCVGYSGGSTKNPSYEQVCTGQTGHAEAIMLEYDPAKAKYEDLVKFFFRMHDPTTLNRQGNDVGTQYRSVIFYYDDEQKKTAERVRDEIQQSQYPGKAIVTTFEKASDFYRAEEYHQQYLKKNPGGYCNHRLRW